eukprot:m51a1_g2573 hypothetical protein (344) ;mRNA; f:384012-385735
MADDRSTSTGFRVLATREFYRKAFRKIGRAARINAIPGVVILALEGAIIALYYGCGKCSGGFDAISDLKESWGYGYSALATAVFGGVLPWIIMVARKDITGGPVLVIASLALLMVQWAGIGCVVESLYKLQVVMFGEDVDAPTVICKVLFDQFVYNPVLGCWLALVPFHWRSCNFSFKLFAETFTVEFAFGTALITLFTIWMVWVPAVTLIYCMPSSLQVPLYNFVLCFSNLLLLLVTKSDSPEAKAKGASAEPESPIEISPLATEGVAVEKVVVERHAVVVCAVSPRGPSLPYAASVIRFKMFNQRHEPLPIVVPQPSNTWSQVVLDTCWAVGFLAMADAGQ